MCVYWTRRCRTSELHFTEGVEHEIESAGTGDVGSLLCNIDLGV